MKLVETNKTKLYLGCGLNAPEGYVNVDGSWSARLAKFGFLRKWIPHGAEWSRDILVHDLRRPLPFPDASFTVVYASHLLEHLYLFEATQLLSECFRVLRPGGVIRLMVPDLELAVAAYCNEKQHPEQTSAAADCLIEELGFRDKKPPIGNFFYKLYSLCTDFHSYKWMYDGASLTSRLKEAGFVDVAVLPRHQSRIADIMAIEKNNGLCVEGTKP